MSELNLDKMGVIYAPWTDAEVIVLNSWQRAAFVNPFRCANLHRRGGLLVARNDGWHCERCNFVQIWAHDFQINAAELRRTIFELRQRDPGADS